MSQEVPKAKTKLSFRRLRVPAGWKDRQESNKWQTIRSQRKSLEGVDPGIAEISRSLSTNDCARLKSAKYTNRSRV